MLEYMSKEKKLKEYLSLFDKAFVAFSGGVDSTYLLAAAHEALGERVTAVTALSSFFPKRETQETIDAVGAVMLDGSNADDVQDYRPGMKAIRELGVHSPLLEVGLTKKEIRFLSEKAGLSIYDKPSFACLASRFGYGESITKEKLSMVEKAEQYLYDAGLTQFRVRYHNALARIEVLPDEFFKILKLKDALCERFEEIGFCFVSLDLRGYSMGNMNNELRDKDV